MQAFQFQYKAVLKQREVIEQGKQRALAKLMHRRNAMVAELRQMQETISTSKREAADGLVGNVDLDAIAGIARYSASCALRDVQQHRTRTGVTARPENAPGGQLRSARRQ